MSKPSGRVVRVRRLGYPVPARPFTAINGEPIANPTGLTRDRKTRPGALIAIAGLILAAAGQAVLDRRASFLPAHAILADAFRPMWPDAEVVLVAIAIFLAAIACFGLAVTRSPRPPAAPANFTESPFSSGLDRTAVVIGGCGLILVAYVVLRLAEMPYQVSLARFYSLGVLLILLGLAWPVRRQLRLNLRLPKLGADALFLLIFGGVFVYLTASDRTSWYFSALGDEYNFYDAAKQLSSGEVIRNLFSQQGAYGIIPVLSSYYQGVLMRLFGSNAAAWKLLNVFPVLFAILACYGLAHSLYGRRVAVLTLSMLASAHYLVAYTHTGYPNLEPLLPSVLCLWAFVEGLRRNSTLLLVVSGLLAGLGWYTYYTSRPIIGVIVLAVLINSRPRSWLTQGLSILSGFFVVLAPMIASDKLKVLTSMLAESGEGTATEPAAVRVLLPIWNAGRSLLAFNYNTHDGPYVHGSLLEPVTAALFVLGLGLAVMTWRDPRSRLLLLWFGLAIIAAGVLSKYDYVSVSRLNYLVPVDVLLAALAADRSLSMLSVALTGRTGSHLGDRIASVRIAVSTLVLVAAVTYGNLYRWSIDTPAHAPSTAEAVAIGIIEDSRCQSAQLPPIVVAHDIGGSLPPAIAAIGIPRAPKYGLYQESASWLSSVASRCVIFRNPREPEALQLAQIVSANAPTSALATVTDYSGERTLVVFYPGLIRS